MARFDAVGRPVVPSWAPSFERIAHRIGLKLRDMYGPPEAIPLPAEHVDLLLRLRQQERDRARAGRKPMASA